VVLEKRRKQAADDNYELMIQAACEGIEYVFFAKRLQSAHDEEEPEESRT